MPTYTQATLEHVFYERSDSRCHLCHARLAFDAYGAKNRSDGWEVDHSVPVSKGGTKSMKNLKAACISCNREKGNGNSRSFRKRKGLTKAPLSQKKRVEAERNSARVGAVVGGVLGMLTGGTALIPAMLAGAIVGRSQDPNAKAKVKKKAKK